MPDNSILTLSNAVVGFRNMPILTEVTIEVYAGEIVALRGPNGIGKSTLLMALAGEKSLISGVLEFSKKPRADLSFHDLAKVRAVMLQRDEASDLLQVNDVLGLSMTGSIPEYAKAFIEKLAPKYLHEKAIGKLSVGQRAKVFLASAILQNTSILMLDEPTASLDDAITQDLCAFLANFTAAGNSVIIASHDDRVLSIATKTLSINDDRLIELI